MSSNSYATREEYLNAFIEKARPHFERVNAPLPSNVRVAVGFTSGGTRGDRIGEIWTPEASKDGYFEIFIRPTIAEVSRVCDVLTIQLIHAAVGIAAGKGAHFKRVATSLGYEGKMSAPRATNALYAWVLPIINDLGPMPYGALSTEGQRPKQATANLKLECPVCAFICRTTKRHIQRHTHLNCPVPDCMGALVCEELERQDDEGEDA